MHLHKILKGFQKPKNGRDLASVPAQQDLALRRNEGALRGDIEMAVLGEAGQDDQRRLRLDDNGGVQCVIKYLQVFLDVTILSCGHDN